VFASFIEAFSQPSARTEANLAALLAEFSEGESMPDEVLITPSGRLERKAAGGQSMVRAALRHYYEALHEPQADARAELCLLANVECGLHEQIRLQPYIAGRLGQPDAGQTRARAARGAGQRREELGAPRRSNALHLRIFPFTPARQCAADPTVLRCAITRASCTPSPDRTTVMSSVRVSSETPFVRSP
jgi:hypothetical protein